MTKSVKERVKVRIPEIDDLLLDEYIAAATDRINLRVGETTLPAQLETVAVEVVDSLHNRKHHAGIKSESVDTFKVSFVDDLLKEYEPDFERYLNNKEKENDESRGVFRFL